MALNEETVNLIDDRIKDLSSDLPDEFEPVADDYANILTRLASEQTEALADILSTAVGGGDARSRLFDAMTLNELVNVNSKLAEAMQSISASRAKTRAMHERAIRIALNVGLKSLLTSI